MAARFVLEIENLIMNENNLKKKIALVTGAAGLLGKEHTFALLELGARVVITDSNLKSLEAFSEELKGSGYFGQFLAMNMDVSNLESIKSVNANIKNEWGSVEILINNASINPKVTNNGFIEESRFENFLLDQWNFEIAVGLTGAYLCSQVFGSDMAIKKSGIILNIASDLSVFAPDQRIYKKNGLSDDSQPVKPVTYSVIKTGLIGLTKYLATYWADSNVRVNALSPGGVYVNQPKDFVERLENLIPMGRMANKKEYRGAVQFLCSDASSYMTGQNLVMDGGRSVW